MIDDFVTRMNYDTARDVFHTLTVELLDEIEKMPPIFPQRVTDLAERIREADRVAHRLRRQLTLEVAG